MVDIETIRAHRADGSEHGHGHSRRYRFLTGFALGVLASVVLAGSGALIVGAFTAASSGTPADCVQPAPAAGPASAPPSAPAATQPPGTPTPTPQPGAPAVPQAPAPRQ
jgi:hypothetical protein